jgi:hypothetical protein
MNEKQRTERALELWKDIRLLEQQLMDVNCSAESVRIKTQAIKEKLEEIDELTEPF